MIDKIKAQAKTIKAKKDILYLIEKVSLNSGFFLLNDKVLFAESNTRNEHSEPIETEYLTLRTAIEIVAVENAPSFKAGSYNFIIFKNSIDDEEFESFVNLCVLYSKDNSTNFTRFFNSIFYLFQKSKEERFTNLVGLWGEIRFILHCDKNGLDLSSRWHRNSNDKYDFVLDKCAIESKASISADGSVLIKHDQVFNGDNIFLVIPRMERNNKGETLLDLVKQIKSHKLFKNNFNFLLVLEKELTKIYKSDAENLRFTCIEFKILDTKKIPQIGNIPGIVTEVSYKYNFLGLDSMSLDELKKKI